MNDTIHTLEFHAGLVPKDRSPADGPSSPRMGSATSFHLKVLDSKRGRNPSKPDIFYDFKLDLSRASQQLPPKAHGG